MDLGLKDKTILITGSNGGIGLEIAKILFEEGAKLILHYNSNRGNLDEFYQNVDNPEDRLLIVAADLRLEDQVIKLFKQAYDKFSAIDGLVNNAGVWPKQDTDVHQMSLAQWENTLATNLTSMFLCTREFIKLLEINNDKIHYPAIVLIGSTAGIYGEAGHSDYSVSKAALHGFMLSVKNEIPKINRHGRINIVSPGWVKTPMAKDAIQDKKLVSKVLQTIAMKKIGQTKDIANAVTFLLSNKVSGHITGQNISITGGMEGRVLWNQQELNLDDF